MNEVPQPTSLDITVNGQRKTIPAGTTVFGLLALLELTQRGIAVEINQEIAPRDCHKERRIHAGDAFEIVTLVGGG